MKPIQYATALSPAGARELAGEDGAYLAGGNDLLALMKEYLVEPRILVNIKSLPGLNRVEPGAGRVKPGRTGRFAPAGGGRVTLTHASQHAKNRLTR